VEQRDVVSTEQAARELGVSADRVRALIQAGRLPAHKLGREWAIRIYDLNLVRVRRPGRPRSEAESERMMATLARAQHDRTMLPDMMRVLAVGSQKGGVSKTTSTLYLASHAAGFYRSTATRPTVAMLDRDESRNLTRLVRLRPNLLPPGVTLLEGSALPPPAAGFRLVLVDTPPGLSAIQSLREAHLVLVPVHPEDQGVANLIEYLRSIEAQRLTISPRLRLLALLPAMVERTVLHREWLAAIDRIAANHRPPLRVLPPVPRRARIAQYDLDAPEYDAPAKEIFGGLITPIAP
jgi:excisionase family DNA binding protein